MNKIIIALLFYTTPFLSQEIDYQREGGDFYPEQYLSEQDSLQWPIIFEISVDVKDIKELDINKNHFFSKFLISSYSEYETEYITHNKKDTIPFDHNEFFELQTKETNLNIKKIGDPSVYRKADYEYLMYDKFITKSVNLIQSPFDVKWNLKNYPFDKQELKFKFTSTVDSSIIKLKPSKNFPSSFEKNMANLEDGFVIDNITYNHSYNQDEGDIIRTSPEIQRPIVTETLEIILNLDRKGSWLYLKLFFGAFISFLISWIIFFIPKKDFESRIELAVAAVFGALGNKYFVESIIPDVQILTKADIINNVVIVLIVYNIMVAIAQKNKKIKWRIIDTDRRILIKSAIIFVVSMIIIRIW
jgi:hypothetical protein